MNKFDKTTKIIEIALSISIAFIGFILTFKANNIMNQQSAIMNQQNSIILRQNKPVFVLDKTDIEENNIYKIKLIEGVVYDVKVKTDILYLVDFFTNPLSESQFIHQPQRLYFYEIHSESSAGIDDDYDVLSKTIKVNYQTLNFAYSDLLKGLIESKYKCDFQIDKKMAISVEYTDIAGNLCETILTIEGNRLDEIVSDTAENIGKRTHQVGFPLGMYDTVSKKMVYENEVQNKKFEYSVTNFIDGFFSDFHE